MLLAVLDGWGMRDDPAFNAIYHAATPHYDYWMKTCPHSLVETCAGHVGLPDGQMGNSEVGHMNLGAGRIVYQDFTRINRSIADGGFSDNPALVATVRAANRAGGGVHIMGLLSPGGVHSHTDHLLAAVRAVARQENRQIFLHAFLDGRDTPPRSALGFVAEFEAALERIGVGRIVSVCGRYYAMDRDQRWERVGKAYEMLTGGPCGTATDPQSAIQNAYDRGENDEFVVPTRIANKNRPAVLLEDGDAVLMMNFRSDRAREISHAFLDPEQGPNAFKGFVRTFRPRLSGFFTLTQYETTLSTAAVGFPPRRSERILGEEFSRLGLKQLRAAETEKYAHVTYFFNGGVETPFAGEDRLLIPSPKVATYDEKPEMSAPELTDEVIKRVESEKYDFILINYANPDMVGHTGRFQPAVKAIETVDRCLGRLAKAVLARGGEMLITSDHGNADCMIEITTGAAHTAHTNNPGPLLYLGRKATLENGRLCDVAPTILRLMSLPQPAEMDGTSLVTLVSDAVAA